LLEDIDGTLQLDNEWADAFEHALGDRQMPPIPKEDFSDQVEARLDVSADCTEAGLDKSVLARESLIQLSRAQGRYLIWFDHRARWKAGRDTIDFPK
jgi:hypothetical protein